MSQLAPQRAMMLPKSLSIAPAMTKERARLVLDRLQKKQTLLRDTQARDLRAAIHEALGVLNKAGIPSAATNNRTGRSGR